LDKRGNKARAKEIMAKELANFDSWLYEQENPEQTILFADYLENWLENVKNGLQITTYSAYKAQVKRIAKYFRSKKIKLIELKPYHIQEFYTYSLKNKVSDGNLVKMHVNIRKCLQSAVKSDIILSNPADKIDRPKSKKHKASFFNLEQLKRLFETSKYNRYDYIYKMTVLYGLRKSEMVGIRWSAIDFDKNILKIDHSVVEITLDNKRISVAKDVLKNKSSNRVYPLLPFVKDMLLKEKAKQEENKKLYKSGYSKEYEDYLCVNDLGIRISGTYVTRNFNNIQKAAGLHQIRFHDLRHSCASLLLALGMSMKQVQEWLGHSTYQTTADIYSHLDYSSKLSVASGLMSAFGTIDQQQEQQSIIEEEKQKRLSVLNNTQPNMNLVKDLFSTSYENNYDQHKKEKQSDKDDFEM
ncbi:MAG: tyrosine-type recombinase/integrase, partial [Clostridia bacterium]|nr:tyrosine-type recombinase/integrase [Clostridia bacterium]